MWLSQQLSRTAGEADDTVSTGKVSIGGQDAAVILEGERRELSTLCPAGIAWAPAAGDEVLVLRSGEGERFILGLAGEQSPKAGPGEIVLGRGDCLLRVGRSGVELKGKLDIQGQLILNGRDVGAALAQLGL